MSKINKWKTYTALPTVVKTIAAACGLMYTAGCAELNYGIQSSLYGSYSSQALEARRACASYGSPAYCRDLDRVNRGLRQEYMAQSTINDMRLNNLETELEALELQEEIRAARIRNKVASDTAWFSVIAQEAVVFGDGLTDMGDSWGSAADSLSNAGTSIESLCHGGEER